MKSDRRSLITGEEACFADSVKYTTGLGTAFATSAGVVGPTIALTADGWTGWVSHTTTPKTCAIYVGSTPLAPAVKEGAPTCTQGHTLTQLTDGGGPSPACSFCSHILHT